MTLRRLLDSIALGGLVGAVACTATPPRPDTVAAAPTASVAPDTIASSVTPPSPVAVDTPPVAPPPETPTRAATRPSRPDTAPTDSAPRRPRMTPRPPHPVPMPMPPQNGDEDAERQAIEQMRRETKALAHTEGCSAADQCTVLPLGERGCGGPEEYLVYCPRSTDVTALKRKAEALLEAERAFNKKHDVMSTCEMRLAPTPSLAAGRCTAAPSNVPRPAPLRDR